MIVDVAISMRELDLKNYSRIGSKDEHKMIFLNDSFNLPELRIIMQINSLKVFMRTSL